MKKRRRSSNSLGKLWILTVLLIGIVIAGLIYLQKHTTSIPTAHKKNNTTIATTTKKPHFDFYTVLPKNKDEALPAATFGTLTPPQKNKPAVPTSTANNTKYILQIAAVKNYADADRLKAQLTLMGYTVAIQKINLHNTTWHRVNLGPYNSLTAAQAAQTNLQKNNIKSILLKIKT